LLAVKEDLAMLVVFFGLYLLTLRELRHGLALIGAGIVWFVLCTRVLIPHFSHGAAYSHWTYDELGSNLGAAALALVRAPWRVFEIGFTPARKLHTIAGLLAPFLLLSLYSRLMILAIPLLLERFLSTDANFWGTAFHYSLSISPVLAMAAADGLANVGRLLGDRQQRVATPLATASMLTVSVALTMFAVRATPPRGLFDSSLYRDSNHAASALWALGAVPPGAVLATNDDLLPHASERPRVSLIAARTLLPDFMVADAGDRVGFETGNLTQQSYGQVLARNATYMTPVYYVRGWLLLRRAAARRSPTNGALEPMPAAASTALVSLAQSWQFELLGAGAKLAACDARWAARDPRAGDCVTAALTGFHSRAEGLASPLAAVVAALRDGCRELGAQALAGTRRLAGDLAKLAPAAGSANRSELPASTAVAGADQRDRDIPGRLERFLILCSPRS
jgi:hypothetical protein